MKVCIYEMEGPKYMDVDSMLNTVYLTLERQCPSDRLLYTKLYPIRSVAAHSSAILKVACTTSPSPSNQIVENPRTSSPSVNLCPILRDCVISS
jgi:hypothetical protein